MISILTLILGFLAGLLFVEFLPSYVRTKAKNLATKEDIAEITTKIEEVKASFALELSRESRFRHTTENFLIEFYDNATSFLYERIAVNFGDFPMDGGRALFEYQTEFDKAVSSLLKSYQRLVVVLAPEQSVLKHANDLVTDALSARKILKAHFGPVKIAFIEEEQTLGADGDRRDRAVKASDKANHEFWEAMNPIAGNYKIKYGLFLTALNKFLGSQVLRT